MLSFYCFTKETFLKVISDTADTDTLQSLLPGQMLTVHPNDVLKKMLNTQRHRYEGD